MSTNEPGIGSMAFEIFFKLKKKKKKSKLKFSLPYLDSTLKMH